MAGFDYARSAQTADRLIERFGGPGQIVQMIPGNGPASDPGPATPSPSPCKLVVVDFSDSERADTKIEQKDRKILVSAIGLALGPETTGKVIVGEGETAETYTIIPPVRTLRPASTTVLYTIQGRR